MAGFNLPDYQVADEVSQQLAREYNGCSFHITRQPLGFWLSEVIFSLRKKRTDAGQVIERVLRKAYNAGMLDDVKDVDKIIRRAFGDVAMPKSKKVKRVKSGKDVHVELDGIVTG